MYLNVSIKRYTIMNNNTTNTGDLGLLIDSAKKTYSLPNDAFDNYRIKRGLREKDGTGVMAGVTRIGNAHGYVVSEGEKCLSRVSSSTAA